ncbi:aminotransferase class III-fold pyridoxal phosphate-dependent enzyme [Alphaproteobacteria bacterium]|nr:aminotransferase class III-fold pyridoxal phosphate-dependent enzyme [Alphaproteobacteria bacterium]
MTKCVAIIQARSGSSRLPGKVLLPLGETTALGLMVHRVKKAEQISEIIIATTENTGDDILCDEARKLGVSFFRGDEQDVLSRVYHAALESKANVIVRLTADCPLMDGQLIDEALTDFFAGDYDYFSNVIDRTFPDGLDIEIFSAEILAKTERECTDAWSREHVTPFMRTGSGLMVETGNFRVGHFKSTVNFAHLRWTLDTASDFEFFCALTEHKIESLGWLDIVSLLTQNSDLLMWNRGITGREINCVSDEEAGSDRNFKRSVQHLSRALHSIPVGSQTFSKSYLGWVMGQAPIYAKSGSGAIITDIDGNDYIDYMMGLLPVVLGHADPFVDAAVVRQLSSGTSLSLSGEIEVELAEKLVSLIPCAEMVRYGKNGSDATTAAVRLARAHTGRDNIIVCGYHGWHDWYIGTTAKHLGVPASVRDLSLTFPFNDADALADLLERHDSDIAALVIEPTGKAVPQPGFLEEVRILCDQHGVVLVFDEVISGFRIDMGGAQAYYNVTPDLAAFGKAMANGYPLSALVGKREIMSKMEDIFFSATFGGELSSIAAAIATITKLESTDGVRRIHKLGDRLMTSLNTALSDVGLGKMICYTGEAWWPRVAFKNLPIEQTKVLALMRQEFVAQNLLIASGLNFCLAHDDSQIFNLTIERAKRAFEALSIAIHAPDPSKFLKGEIAMSDFEVRGHIKA